MNLIITETCNRACPYCFAKKADSSPAAAASTRMSLENLQICIDYAVRGGVNELRFLGGEPTVHPQIMQFIREVRGRGLKLRIFSNGIWSDAVQREMSEYLAATRDAELWFIFNINEPSQQPPAETQRQARSLEIAGQRGRCGFNIYREDFDLRFLGSLIRRYRLQRTIRVGLASPIVGVDNACLSFESLRRVGQRLVEQARQLEKQEILLSFDCGMPLCMFSDAELGALSQCMPIDEGNMSCCFPPLDIGPDLTVWPCFPLRGMMDAKLTDFADRKDVMNDFAARLIPLQRLGMRDECLTCHLHKRRQCCGGCVARVVRNLDGKR